MPGRRSPWLDPRAGGSLAERTTVTWGRSSAGRCQSPASSWVVSKIVSSTSRSWLVVSRCLRRLAARPALDRQDQQENELSLRAGYRLLSAYKLKTGEKTWIITEADRSVTTLLLPEEY